MKLFTIGFTRKSAETFFATLRAAGVARVVDVRLRNASQLAGFAKRGDLPFFLRAVAGIDYHHELLLAPSVELLDDYKRKRIVWAEYERLYRELIAQRRIEKTLSKELLADGCLLCSEAAPTNCHRRLAAEYLAQHWGDVRLTHL